MITRSAVKKSYSNQGQITKPLSFTTKNITESAVKTKMSIKTPKRAYNGDDNSEGNLENVQSPVFNIHVHMPTTVTGDLKKSGQCQPVIHLHFGELIHKLSPGTTSGNFEIINESGKVESPSEVSCNSEMLSNSPKSKQTKPPKKSIACKKLNFNGNKGINKNIKTEKSEAALKSVEKIEDKEGFPVRRSVRLANNRKLLKTLKDLSPNKNITTKNETKCRNVTNVKKCRNENESNPSGETVILKDAMVVLHDIRKEMENVTSYNDAMESEQDACFSCCDTNACDADSQEKVEECSDNLLSESDCVEKSEGTEENEKNFQNSSDNLSMISLSKKFGEIYPLVYSSDDETNSVTDILDNCNFSEEVREILQNVVEPKEGVCDSLLEVEDNSKVTNDQVVNNKLFQLEEDKTTAIRENNLSPLPSNDQKVSNNPSMNMKYNSLNDDNIVSMNSNLNNSIKSSNNQSNSGDSDSDLSRTADIERDNHETALLNAFDVEKVINCFSSENNILEKNVIEDNELPSADSDGYKEINANTLNFQLELIKKEMKKRNISVKKKSRKKKSPNKKEASQISKEACEKSQLPKKMKLTKKITTNMSAAENKEKFSSARDYIPLQISGPTEFAVAQLSKIKPYGAHKAKNFKNEMLFGKRINRYSNPKCLETYLLKKKAAAKRNK